MLRRLISFNGRTRNTEHTRPVPRTGRTHRPESSPISSSETHSLASALYQADMRLERSTAVQIACGLLILASCVVATPKSKSTSLDKDEGEIFADDDNASKKGVHKKQLDDEIDLDDAFDAENLKSEQLPILPPIILLDFVNGTDDASTNSTEGGDEKSKRTIDGSLGYGYNRNNLFSGKHNFYFPAGKTGTTVSIEESFSPFEPKTVTEVVKPISERPESDNSADRKKKPQPLFEALPDPLPLENNREPLPIYPPYPIFGQRTKLQKTSSSDFGRSPKPTGGSYTTAATPGSETYNKLLATYTSVKQTGFQTGSGTRFASPNVSGYARPMTSPMLANYMSDIYSSSTNQKSSYDLRPSPTSNPAAASQEINLANYPRYTFENGIKYEHKIVWKYPDGKISEMPPSSYVNAYTEFAEQQRINMPGANAGGFRPSAPYQPRPAVAHQQPATGYVPYTGGAQNNIYSPRPVQFPTDQEQQNNGQQKEPSRFVSSSSMVANGNQFDAGNSYNLQAYQGQYGLRMTPRPGGYRPITSQKTQYAYSNHRAAPKYPISNADSEYHVESGHENLFSPNGQINKQVLSKYTPEVQQYLMKVFANGKISQSAPEQSGTYANTEYSNLLNYNPSISQYIKNPSSILNAQPTFVQAGNSLIPVIILRVDGAPPIQPKAGASNINLKSLLRQYLTQYANSVSKVSQNTNFDFGGDEIPSASQTNPVEDLKHLTESLESLRQRGHQDPDFTAASYAPQQHSAPGQEYATSYNGFVKDYQTVHSPHSTPKPHQKVKNVQIIEDPRYTSYKVDH